MFLFKIVDERTKKAFLVVCALFVVILLIFGLIYSLINNYLKKSAKKIDSYMFDLCKYQIVKNPNDFIIAVDYYEKRRIYEASRWTFRGLILVLVLAISYGIIFNDGNISQLFTEFKNIFPTLKWQTIGDVNNTLIEQGLEKIPGWNWMPVSFLPNIYENPNLDTSNPILYASLIFYLILIILIFKISCVALTYQVRLKRAKIKSKEVFEKTLDNVNFATVLDQPIITSIEENEKNEV